MKELGGVIPEVEHALGAQPAFEPAALVHGGLDEVLHIRIRFIRANRLAGDILLFQALQDPSGGGGTNAKCDHPRPVL